MAKVLYLGTLLKGVNKEISDLEIKRHDDDEILRLIITLIIIIIGLIISVGLIGKKINDH